MICFGVQIQVCTKDFKWTNGENLLALPVNNSQMFLTSSDETPVSYAFNILTPESLMANSLKSTLQSNYFGALLDAPSNSTLNNKLYRAVL